MTEGAQAALLDRLLLLVFRRRLIAPDQEAGLALLAGSGDEAADADAWRAALADALAAGYVHDPVRLPAGALQCHWHLELTPAGVARARQVRAGTEGPG